MVKCIWQLFSNRQSYVQSLPVTFVNFFFHSFHVLVYYVQYLEEAKITEKLLISEKKVNISIALLRKFTDCLF